MSRRASVLFWGSTVAATLFLGSIWAVMHSASRGPGPGVVLAISSVGLSVTAFIAGRIVLVSARLERALRRTAAPDRGYGQLE